MAVGVGQTAMNWEQIVDMMDVDQPSKKRGPYKSNFLEGLIDC